MAIYAVENYYPSFEGFHNSQGEVQKTESCDEGAATAPSLWWDTAPPMKGVCLFFVFVKIFQTVRGKG